MRYIEPDFAVCDNCSKSKCPFYIFKPFDQSAVCMNGGFSSLSFLKEVSVDEKTHEKK